MNQGERQRPGARWTIASTLAAVGLGLVAGIGCNGEQRSVGPEVQPTHQTNPVIPQEHSSNPQPVSGVETGSRTVSDEEMFKGKFNTELETLDGQKVTLANYLGKPMVLAFIDLFHVRDQRLKEALELIKNLKLENGNEASFLVIIKESFPVEPLLEDPEFTSINILKGPSVEDQFPPAFGVTSALGYAIVDGEGKILKKFDGGQESQLSTAVQGINR